MTTICNADVCTGCSACLNVCSRGAIRMTECAPLGHIHPVIDADLCIDCGACRRVCPALCPPEYHEPSLAVAAIAQKTEECDRSASGGAAFMLGRVILQAGGVVYGAEMKSYREICHERYESEAAMGRMRGSKYVQSEIGLSYRLVRKDLQAGRPVLFTGTPCQIAGLKNYLHRDYDNLYCVDICCHGVPSRKLLRENVEAMFAECGKQPSDELKVSFRQILSASKEALNIQFGVFCGEAIPMKKQLFLENDYITAFMHGVTFRDSCYSCPYAQGKRVSDVTVSDYWGLPASCTVPQGRGVSLMLASTPKGEALIERAKPYLIWERRTVEEAIRGNGQLMHAFPVPTSRALFLRRYPEIGQKAYRKAIRQYRVAYRYRLRKAILSKYPIIRRIHREIYKIVRRFNPLIDRV